MASLYRAKVAISVTIYCISVSAVPIYNKRVFAGAGTHDGGVKKFPYPIATAFVQLGLVALVLGLANVFGHAVALGGSKTNTSWIFGPHFLYKLRCVAPVGFLFGLKYGLTNWGLQLMPTGMHLLLQSTDIIWTVLAARVWNKEKLGLLELLAATLATCGSGLIGLHAGQVLVAPLVPLLINCLTPVMLASCVSTLRAGTQELFRADNRLCGSVSHAEFTCLKLSVSALTTLLVSLATEGDLVTIGWHTHRKPWWAALMHEQPMGVLLLILGGAFVLVFQVNITWLSGLTSAATVGIVGGVKVVPQWLMNAAFLGTGVDLAALNVVGAALVLSASCLYAWSISQQSMLLWGSEGLQWQPRECCSGLDRSQPLLATEPFLHRDVYRKRDSWRWRGTSAEGFLTLSAMLEVFRLSFVARGPETAV